MQQAAALSVHLGVCCSASNSGVSAAYGSPLQHTGTDPNPFGYGGSAGYYTDSNMAGLLLCGQRWYAPYFARWLSRDPIGYDGGANLYEYCGGNPVGAADPTGLDDDDPDKYLDNSNSYQPRHHRGDVVVHVRCRRAAENCGGNPGRAVGFGEDHLYLRWRGQANRAGFRQRKRSGRSASGLPLLPVARLAESDPVLYE